MPHKRLHGLDAGPITISNANFVSASDFICKLPNELLLEIWAALPSLERIFVSQTCSHWRSLALASPRHWTRLAVVSGRRKHGSAKRAPAVYSIHNPCTGSFNLAGMEELLRRSKQLPLDLTINWRSSLDPPQRFYTTLKSHSHRIHRLHFSQDGPLQFDTFVHHLGGDASLPALRTLTAGFDEDDVEFADAVLRPHPAAPQASAFPALTQVRLGPGVAQRFLDWSRVPLASVAALTLAPIAPSNITPALHSCANLRRLTLVMAKFDARGADAEALARSLAHIPELWVMDFPRSLEQFVQDVTTDNRLRSATLDYRGRALSVLFFPTSWPPIPCEALSDLVHLSVRLRESRCEIEVIDCDARHRKVLLDSSSMSLAPGLWDLFLRKRTVVSATVDALAWGCFAAGIPDDLAIRDLTITVLHDPTELNEVSLEHVASLQKLRIDVVQHGLRFAHTAVARLVRSRADSRESLAVLSLTSHAHFGDADSLLKLAESLYS